MRNRYSLFSKELTFPAELFHLGLVILTLSVLFFDFVMSASMATSFLYLLIVIYTWSLKKLRYLIPLCVGISFVLIFLPLLSVELPQYNLAIFINRFVALTVTCLVTFVLIRSLKTYQNEETYTRELAATINKSHDALKKSEQSLADMQRLSDFGRWEWQIKTDELVCSKRMFQLWGVPASIGSHFNTFFSNLHPEEAVSVEKDIANTIENEGYSAEYKILKDDGEQCHIAMKGEVIFDSNGNPDRVIGTAVDITENKSQLKKIDKYQKKLNALLKERSLQFEKSTDKSEAKSLFLSNMSHEFRTPMYGIIATLDLLKKTSLDNKQNRLVNIAKSSSDNFLILINEILDFSRINANEVEIELIPVDMQKMMFETLNIFSSTVRRKELLLSIFVEPSIPINLISDPQKIKQIIINLLGNAIKFTNNRADIVGKIDVNIFWECNTLCIKVKDNGVGIEKEKLNFLFEPFTQEDASTQREYGGTGLGLPIAKGLVDLLEGRMTCESERFSGTSFEVIIPIQMQEAKHQQKKSMTKVTIAIIGLVNAFKRAIIQELEYQGSTAVNFDTIEGFLQSTSTRVFDLILFSDESIPPFSLINRTPIAILNFGLVRHVDTFKENFQQVEANPFLASDITRQLALMIQNKSAENEKLNGTSVQSNIKENDFDKNIRILVAEDNLHNQELIKYQLNFLGFECDIVADGKLAIEFLQNESFTMLVTDCHMPKVDGYELTGLIRSGIEGINQDMPIVGLTGDLSDDGLLKCKNVGMDSVIGKPASIDDFKQQIIKFLPTPQDKEKDKNVVLGNSNDSIAADESTSYLSKSRLDDSSAKLFLEDDDEIIKKFRIAYLEKNKTLIDEIKSSIQEENASKIKQLSHKLKSSSKFIGAERMSHLCGELEQLSSENGIFEKIHKLADLTINEFNELRTEILQRH